MADPQTADQGFLAGLLGKFGADPAAAYGGLLSDPATQRQFALRSLGAAAQAFGQGAMPVPYKGGIPFGATLGAAGGAAATAGDELIKARLEEAQTLQAQQTAEYAKAQRGLLAYLPEAQARAFGDTGTPGTGADGKKLTGPAAIIAGQGGKVVSSTTADASLPPEARALLDTISGPESNGAYNVRWGGPSGDKTFDSYAAHPNIPEPGPQGDSTAAGRYQIVNKTWKPLQAKYGFGDFTPVTQDQAGWHLAADTYKEQTGRDLLTDLQAGKTDQVASALHGQWSTLNMGSYGKNLGKYQGGGGASPQTASTSDQPAAPSATPPAADLGPQTASGGAYSVPPPPGPPPKPGEYAIPVRAGNVPPPPVAPPMAPSAAPSAGLPNVPDFSRQLGAPPDVAPPPGRAPGVGVTGLLGPQPNMPGGVTPVSAAGGGAAPGNAPQGPPPQGVPLPGRLGGMGPVQGGAPPGLIHVADTGGAPAGAAPNLVPGGAGTNLPPQAPVTAGPPPPQSAAIRSLLEPLQPAPAPAAAPAPPGAGAAPPQPPRPMPQPAPAPAAPAPNAPIPGAPTADQIANARRAIFILNANHMPVDPALVKISEFPLIGPAAAAGAAATLPYDIAKAVAPQTERGIQTRITEGDKVINVPGLGWVQQKNIPGYTIAQNQTNSLVPTVGGVPGTTYAANGGNNPQTGTALFPSQTDAQKQFLTKNIEAATKELDGYHTELQTAPAQVAQAQAINDLMGRTQMGWGANTKQEGAMILQGLGVSRENIQQFLGVDPTAGAALNKLFLKFSADAVRTMGSREAASVITLFASAYPSLESDPDAARLMTSALQMDAQWKVDRAKAADRWAAAAQQNAGAFGQNYHGMQGFGEAFLNQADPHNYWKASAAMGGANATTAQGATDMQGIAWKGVKPGSAEEKRVYDLIPAGTRFRASDGNIYTKPGQ